MKLIDLHCHILPGVDDGSKDMQMSLDLARAAVDQGITNSLVTPHHMDGEYTNHKKDVIRKTDEFQQALDSEGIPLTVFASQEVHLTGELMDAIAQDDVLFMDESNRYLLLELPHSGIPEYTADMIFDLTTRGITPVIAHPERNHGFQEDPDKIYDFVKMGCLTQLTSSSYLGIFGKHVQKLTENIIKANLGFVFSSDTHNFKGRRYLMREAFDKLEKEEGPERADLYKMNAKNIINGDDIEELNIKRINSLIKQRRFWFF
ncbi:tyrosine protein phosphatase [Companilactobacillus suantsaicola]|uniref:Tyrosine-protein phosphatase n=1 Tax=Companilactobacillus suantsaicola TaxID=2487723 RepID=A0A4Z0JL56_9LACO|nr:CpsB/CapC family capsule biosynthesis tyrosine phosphatase [Companilactobacillus suantsaicola]TGD22744.1 tyrosine protein phosphatase [Companilactobacillus suantsaicola]